MASPGYSDFNDAEGFDEYNPHPYQGGYDIALTYGPPLPPSSAICYPISPSPSSSPAPEPPSDPAGHQGEPERRAPREGGEAARGSDCAGEAWDWGSGYGVDGLRGSEDGFRGYWPFPAQEFEGSHGGRRFWDRDILNCAAEYLFGYLHTYGEKRHESHNYGNLNYAYERHHPQEPLLIRFSPHEPSWCGKPSYHEDCQEEVSADSGYALGYDGRDSSEVSHSEIACVGSSWNPTSYHEDYSRHMYPQSECSYAYERGYYEQPISVQHEQIEHTLSQEPSFSELHEQIEHTWSQKPSFLELHEQIEQTWSQKPSFPKFCESHVHPQPADMHAYGSKLYEQPLDMFDFIEKSWYQMLNNNESGEVNSYPHFKTHDDSWNKREQSYFPFCKYSDYDD